MSKGQNNELMITSSLPLPTKEEESETEESMEEDDNDGNGSEEEPPVEENLPEEGLPTQEPKPGPLHGAETEGSVTEGEEEGVLFGN